MDRCRARGEVGSLVTEENARSDLGALGVLRSDLRMSLEAFSLLLSSR